MKITTKFKNCNIQIANTDVPLMEWIKKKKKEKKKEKKLKF